MNVKDIATKVKEEAKLSQAASERVVKAVFETIGEELKQGEKVDIYSFGKFGLTDRKAREGRNPKTGVKIQIPAQKRIKFEVSGVLKSAINA